MDASLPLVLGALAPLVFAGLFLYMRVERGRFRERLQEVAARHGGRVSQDSFLTWPRLSVPLPATTRADAGSELQISAIFGDGSGGHTHTFAWLGGLDYVGGELEVRRVGRCAGLTERFRWTQAATGDASFDAAFRFRGDAELAGRVLTPEVRRALAAFELRRRVRVSLAETSAYRDGRLEFGEREPRLSISLDVVPPELAELLGLVELARRVQAALAP